MFILFIKFNSGCRFLVIRVEVQYERSVTFICRAWLRPHKKYSDLRQAARQQK